MKLSRISQALNSGYELLGRQISRQILKNERALGWRDPQTVAGHFVDRSVPICLAASINDHHLDVVTASAHALNEVAVRALRERALRASARDRADKHCAQDANQQT